MAFSKVVFLDRDGVIINDGDYLFDPAAVELIPGAGHSIAALRDAGFVVICVSNQSGVASERNGGSIAAVDACNRRMQQLLHAENANGSFLDVRYSPHAKGEAFYRKPCTGLIDSIKPWVDVQNSYMVGDRESDLQLGLNFGLPKENCIRVCTGKPDPVPGFPEVSDINEAVRLITGK